jgi:uncharacterized protein
MSGNKLFGREVERQIIVDHSLSTQSSLIAIIGRRRIGKTYLVRRALENKIDFEMTGSQNGTLDEQLQNFHIALRDSSKSNTERPIPRNWIEALDQLKKFLVAKKGKRKKVIFFDEFPWINSPRSGFVEKFAHFWNSWASENNVMIILCGSAATWMIKHVVNGKGGLHNRISHTIYLKQFQLQETREMLVGMGIKATESQLAELYMIFGGVPYYLSLFLRGKSIPQNIDALLYKENGKLVKEFENLLPSLFDNAANHLDVLQAMASKWKGLTRSELASSYKKTDGGGLTQVLADLEYSGFITSYQPFGKIKKETLFRISDSYILFYLKFLKRNRQESFLDIAKTANYRIWCGYAFENLCLQHIGKIKETLGLGKIISFSSSYLSKGNKYEDGYQFDLIIERADSVINVCEMKYYNGRFVIDKKMYQKVKDNLAKFQTVVGNKVVLHYTMVTTNGCIQNEYFHDLVDEEVTLSDLIK